jgi:hypothetical protein
LRHLLAGAIQSASLYFVFGFRGVQWITPWLVYFLLARDRSAAESLLWALASAIAVPPILILTAVGAKWMLLGRVQPGRHPLWGAWHLKWWFVQTLFQSVPLGALGGTPLLPFVYRLLGARIGGNVHIATDLLAAFDLISIGEGSSIDEGASLLGGGSPPCDGPGFRRARLPRGYTLGALSRDVHGRWRAARRPLVASRRHAHSGKRDMVGLAGKTPCLRGHFNVYCEGTGPQPPPVRGHHNALYRAYPYIPVDRAFRVRPWSWHSDAV